MAFVIMRGTLTVDARQDWMSQCCMKTRSLGTVAARACARARARALTLVTAAAAALHTRAVANLIPPCTNLKRKHRVVRKQRAQNHPLAGRRWLSVAWCLSISGEAAEESIISESVVGGRVLFSSRFPRFCANDASLTIRSHPY